MTPKPPSMLYDIGWRPLTTRLLTGTGTGLVLAALAACGGGGSKPAPPPPAPTITSQPADATVVVGNPATFSVVATGSPTYQWTKGGTAISSNGTSATYTTAATAVTDNNAVFAVTVTNAGGAVTSTNATLHVNYVSITTQPVDASVTVGQPASFTVAASGSGTLTYQWQKAGSAINGATNATFPLTSASASDSGSYTCVVTSTLGTTTTSATTTPKTLTVITPAPAITTQPADRTVVAGNAATFSVVASNAASYQWFKGNTPAQEASATSATYTTDPTIASNDGTAIHVDVTNVGGTTSSSVATLHVNYVAIAPASQPANATIAATQPLNLSVGTPTHATGSTLSYQWNKGATAVGTNAPTFTLPSLATTDAGSYTCTITSSLNGTTATTTSNPAEITVVGLPIITAQPVGGTFFPGDQLNLGVTATFTGSESYQWKKNGTAIPGATLKTYTVLSLAAGDAGDYTCDVTNTLTSVPATVTTSVATVVVQLSPGITAQPVNRSVMEGQTATFNVTAKGPGTLSYQWYKGNAPVGGNSASYTTPAVALADDGSSYTCVVSNGTQPNATSAAATLTVTPLVPTFNASRTAITNGEGVTFTYTFSAGATAAVITDGTTPVNVLGTTSSTVFPDLTTYPTGHITYTLNVTVGGVTTPTSIPVTVKTYTPKWYYVVNNGSNDIYQYPVNAASPLSGNAMTGYMYDDGSTTPANALIGEAVGSPIAAGNGAIHIATTLDEKYFYVANNTDGTISAYTANATTGVLTAITGSPFALPAGFTAPYCSASTPDGTRLYVGCAEGIAVLNIDGSTGALTAAAAQIQQVVAGGRGQGDIVIHPSGKFLYATDSVHSVIKPYAIDATTGALTAAGTDASPKYATGVNNNLGPTTIYNPTSLVFDRAGTMLFTRSTDFNWPGSDPMTSTNAAIDIYLVDPSTGDLTHKSVNESVPDAYGAYLVPGQVDGYHSLAFSALPGVDHLYNTYANDQMLWMTFWSAWTVDTNPANASTYGKLTGYFADADWQAEPRSVMSQMMFTSGGSSIVRDRSGKVFAVTFNWDNMIFSYGSDASGNQTYMGTMFGGETPRTTGTTPVHGVFTGTLQ
ncbi:hypothetical protein GETHLI_30460 [Geothrix limicola]|uniref:Ig-like domain-containing protein n=1 Tax=Geothrix limicola TaxID=2927978 RepID=A0ABQ5QI53_9BACT|nr:immunoglobulin domain-containing protein [Geothrix limicola]GLH74544.1 hypothetical protein GETHLI_30460 [Geothrix limicola]